MNRKSPVLALLAASCLLVVGIQGSSSQTSQSSGAGRRTPQPELPVESRAPDTVKEGEVWIPPLPSRDEVQPPAGWEPDGREAPPMPLTLLRLPRTNIFRAKYPAIDFHVHGRGLTTRECYESLIQLMDSIGMGAIVNLDGGTGETLDATLKAGEPYWDRVANFITFSTEGINEPGWPQRFAAEMERAFKAGALGMKVSKALGQSARNPDGTFIQADDPVFGSSFKGIRGCDPPNE